jgi:hypothetical protein
MSSMSFVSAKDAEFMRSKQEILTDYRTRLALENEARAQQRRLDMAEQCSDSNPPATRVSTWEKLHGLRMPADPEHPILEIIAEGTRLRLSEVLAVQAARKPPTPKPASAAVSDADSHASNPVALESR